MLKFDIQNLMHLFYHWHFCNQIPFLNCESEPRDKTSHSKSNVHTCIQINHTTLNCLTVFTPFHMHQQCLLLHVITIKADVDGVANNSLFNNKFDTVTLLGGGAGCNFPALLHLVTGFKLRPSKICHVKTSLHLLTS